MNKTKDKQNVRFWHHKGDRRYVRLDWMVRVSECEAEIVAGA
jgi:hypothetical protein